jgi:hypothetical protein
MGIPDGAASLSFRVATKVAGVESLVRVNMSNRRPAF